MGNGTGIVVIKGIGGEIELRAFHLHIEVKHRHLGFRVILSPVRSQRGLSIHHFSTLEEISIIVQTVEIEGVGIEGGLTVFEHHIITGSRHLLVTIVIGIVGYQRQGITLIHLYVSKSLKRIAGLVEISTVTIETGTDMGKLHLAI